MQKLLNISSKILSLFRPSQFLLKSEKFTFPLSILTISLFVVGLIDALILSPADYQQGETVRILYVHVPASWIALSLYCGMAGLSFINLVWGFAFGNILIRSIAPVGLSFNLISLVTGSIWGLPIWGTWWIWDARLTSMLILLFIYSGYLIVFESFRNQQYAYRACNFLILLGAINIPIIKWSVEWWHTLHQPSSISRFSKPALDFSMIRPLFLMTLAFISFAFWIILNRTLQFIRIIKRETIK